MARKKILWLCSWYPNRIDPFNGDFIQRHARAVSLYADVYVFFAGGYSDRSIHRVEKNIAEYPGLTEQVILFKKDNSVFGRLVSHFDSIRFYKEAIVEYIKANGKPDYIHVHVPLKAGVAAIWAKRKYNLPYLLTEHWGIYNNLVEDSYQRRNTFFRRSVKKVITGADKLLSVSKYLATGINELVSNKKYVVIENVVDTSVFSYKQEHKEKFCFIHVSNMVPLKNAEGILKAFKKLKQKQCNADLVMVGNTEPYIVSFANSLGFDGKEVQFLGEISYAKVAAAMQASDCFILFSNIENSPCVIGEALCCGLPVIASRVGGVPELVNDKNGLLVTPGDEDALVNGMMQVMNNYTLFDRKKIAEDAISKFSYKVVGRKIYDQYSKD